MNPSPLFGFAFGLGRSHPPRRLGWWLLFGAPAVLMAALMLTLRETPVAQAVALDTFVNCSVSSENYTTIQEAVTNTAPGGVVHICPSPSGFYSESINLALMNEGNGVGDITLLAENGPGTVLISPTVGAAIHISFNIFIADIALIGLNVTSGDSYGIDLYDPDGGGTKLISGTVLISDVVANNAGAGGIIVNATRGVTILNSEASNNEGTGIELLSYGNVNPVPAVMTLDHVAANNNHREGILIETSGSVYITNTEANSNGVDCDGCYSGIEIGEGFPPLSSCPDPLNQVRLDQVTADDNSAFGVYVYVSGRDVWLNALQTNGNYFDGTAVEYGSPICYMGSLHLSNSVADENGLASLNKQGEVGAEIFVPDPVGFRLTAIEQISATNSSATGNAAAGFCLYNEFGDIEIRDVRAENNGQDGVELSPECRYYGGRAVTADEPAPTEQGVGATTLLQSAIQIANTTVFSNGDNGIELEYSNEYENQNTGVSQQQVNGQLLLSEQPLTITNVSAVSNAENGILVGLEFHEPIGSQSVFDEAATLKYPPTTIASSLIQGNQQHGVRFRSRVFDYVAPAAQQIQVTQPFSPAAFVNGNIICQNIASGLSISDTVETVPVGPFAVPAQEPLKVDATGNWWGAASGPAHPDNSTPGTGDAVVDSFNGGSGEVLFTPWISQIRPSAVPSPTLAGLLTALTFQFSDNGNPPSAFLGQGVGNLNDPPPFRVSTNNGTLNGFTGSGATVGQYISDDEGKLDATLTPAASGVATVQLAGPCGLVQTLNVPVAAPSVQIEKTPDLQVVPAGGPVTFTIRVTNTGNITLTELAVSDPQVSACERSLNNLGPGQFASYQCSFTPSGDLVNQASVSGRALIGGTAQGAPVTDSDTATVDVKALALSLQKTVGIQGYGPACPTPTANPPKVPIGTVMKYCYTATNTGEYTFTTHSLVDDKEGTIFTNLSHSLPPGASFSSVQAGLTITAPLSINTTNVATWTAGLNFPAAGVASINEAQALVAVSASAQAVVTISGPTDDQDNDGVLDNTEGAGDEDNDGIPNFLDPTTPTNLGETEQPGRGRRLYLPSLPD